MKTASETQTAVEKVIKELTDTISVLKFQSKETLTNSSQFERNCRVEYKVEIYEKNIEYINKWNVNIGKQVFKTLKTFTYSENCNATDVLNKTELESVLFTEELFNGLLKDIVEYWIKRYSEDLVTRSITNNSSNKLSNLMFEWRLESKQELIVFYKELLEIINKK